MKPGISYSLRQTRLKERGQVLVLFVLFSIVLFLAAVIAIDLGTYVWERQQLEIAVDAAALAGGLELPDDGVAAKDEALDFLGDNEPGVTFSECTGGQTPVDTPCVRTSFRCLVGDRDSNEIPDSSDIPATCYPGPGASWSCADQLCVTQCVFFGANRCNVIDVFASKEVSLTFTRVLGLSPILISASQNGACKGYCGTAPTALLDVMLVIDRSGSLSASELAAVKNGALTSLEYFDPQYHYVGLAVFGAAIPSDFCDSIDPGNGGTWLVVPLSDDYKNADGTINTSSDLVSTINCLETSSQGTNLGSPLSDSVFNRPDALDEFQANGRENAAQGIILFSDGAANEPDPMPGPGDDNPCEYANDRATVVKNESIELFTIGYAVTTEDCNDASGPYDDERTTELLADMATDSLDDQGHCLNAISITAENNDGDHFLCQAEGGDLDVVFATAASALAPGVRLIGPP